MKIKLTGILISSILILISCKHSKHMQVSKINTTETNNELSVASPSSCIVVATVLSIYPPDSTQVDSWCSKFSCTALLQIDEIKSCGSGATGMIDLTSNTEAGFIFTLAPTDSVDQTLTMKLPGLKIGDKILTALHIMPSLGNSTKCSVYSYKILTQ